MALPVSYYTLTIADNTVRNGQPETTSVAVPITTLTSGNVVAQTTLVGNLQTAIAALTIGNLLKSEMLFSRTLIGAGAAADPLAQRENKLLLRYHDAVEFQKFQVSIGTFDLTFLIANSEYVDLAAGAGLALKTAFEAVVVSPADSAHAVILDSAQFVGRNT